ncbi:diguanylate cyclase domain-containing protein [Synechococcus sp. ATX 2A4]|uniref:diguanylate cyclase domain-containing protein n=1 Tax=Synechococcus sp. ATX 2A4 TaxID=2823727 RepID=UPI0037D9D99C
MADGLSEEARRWIADFCLVADLNGTDLIVLGLRSGHFVACNDSAHTRLGYSKAELLGLSPAAIQADPDHDAAWVASRLKELVVAGGGYFQTRHRCKDNTILDVEVHHRVLSIQGEQLMLSSVRDLTAAHQHDSSEASAYKLLSDGEAFSGIGSWELRVVDGTMRCSPQMRRLCQWMGTQTPTTLTTYGALVHPDDRSRWHQEFQRAMNLGEPLYSRHRLAFFDGSVRLVQAEAHFTYDNTGEPLRAIGTLQDVSREQRLLQQRVGERTHDLLTGLPNKLAALEELNERLQGRGYSNSLAVLSLDVDGFQDINDQFGSEVGDRVLWEMARRLQELMGPEAWLARLSSDEFLIVLEDSIHSLGDGLRACRQLQQRWGQQMDLLSDLPLLPTFSIGLASYPEHGQNGQALIQCANTALAKAKSQGRIQVCAYSSTISRQIQERMHLSGELSQAIGRNQFRLVVQPQVHRSSALAGAEVLLRWTNSQGIHVPPSHFIPLAEQSGQILQVGSWVFEQTLQQLVRWRDAGLPVPRLALNISPRELEMPGRQFISSLLDGLLAHNLSPELLELEITETALLHDPLVYREHLRVLSDQGFRIAIDDFGTGYASLELLRDLPVHRLKIDRTFIQGITTSAGDRTIVQATITLAKGLGLECIAEGVETDEQRQVLEDLGCDLYQGYLCGRPLELDAFESLLRDPKADSSLQSADDPPHTPKKSSLNLNKQGELVSNPSTSEELELLRSAFDLSNDYFLLLQVIQGHQDTIMELLILEANQSACSYMQQEHHAVVGKTLLNVFPQMEHNGLLDIIVDAALRSTPTYVDDFVYEEHELFWDRRCYDIQIIPTRGFLVVSWRDVTDRSHTARTLAESAALYRLLTDNIVEVVVLLNLREEVLWVSPSLEPMTGWREAQWIGKTFCELFVSADGRPEPVELKAWLTPHGPIHQGRLRLVDPKGGWGWAALSVRRLHEEGRRSGDSKDAASSTLHDDADSAPAELHLHEGYVITLQPVDQKVLEERRLLQRANHDPLTGLESRAAILDRLEERLLDDKSRKGQPLALLFCDCDGFKNINDTYGHACGDAVLQSVAARIQDAIRQRDHAGRIGGDEFLVLLDGIKAMDHAIAVAEKVQAAIAKPIHWADHSITPSFSIGVALHGAGEDAGLFLRRADRNMYAAKAAGRQRVVAL